MSGRFSSGIIVLGVFPNVHPTAIRTVCSVPNLHTIMLRDFNSNGTPATS